MTPQELKASILQLAIQGKLVPQIESEGNAEDLYKEIQKEKQKLIAEKKIKKEKPLDPIKEEEIPFDIPDSWKYVRVGEIGSWASGATPSRTNQRYYGGNIPWLKTGDLTDGDITYIPEFITDLALEQTSVRLNPIGSVLMAMYGATIGKLGILKIEATTNQACCACIPYNGVFNKYVFYYLMAMRKNYIGMAEGGAQPNISKEKIVNSVIPLPPLEEQKRIVAKIEELLPLVERYGKAYTRLEEFNKKFPGDMKKSVLQMAIQGKLVEQRPEEGTAEELYELIQTEKAKLIKEGKIKKEKSLEPIKEEEIPFDIPRNWKWCRLSELCKQISDGTHKTPSYLPNGVPFLSVKDISSGVMKFDDVRYISTEEHLSLIQRCKPEKGDVLMCRIGTLGKAIKIIIEKEFSIFVSLGLIKPLNSSLSDYLVMTINSGYGDMWIQENKVGGGTHTNKINLDDLRNMPIPLPPLEEQKRIVAKLEEVLPLCDALIK